MISLIDAAILAHTKLKFKRIMLFMTIVVASLLFGLLFAAVVVVDGIAKSANSYTQAALNGKYFVKSTPVLPLSIFGPSTTDLSAQQIDELTAIQNNYITQQKTLTKQLNVPFDQNSIQPILVPNPYANKDAPKDTQVMINTASPVYQIYLQKLQQDYVKVANNTLGDLKKAAAPYGAMAYHQNQQATVNFSNLTYLANGKEDLTKLGSNARPSNTDLSPYGYLTNSVRSSTYAFVDNALVQRFILPSTPKRQANATAIPVVITTAEALDIFGPQYGIDTEPRGTTAQIAWMKNLQQKINGATYTACYRNNAETSEIAQIMQTAAEIAQNKDNKDYAKPPVIYNLPTTACGSITVKEDTRTTAQKKADQQQQAISQQLGTYVAPQHQLLTFQVVGVMPVAPPTNATGNFGAFLSSLLGAQYGQGAIIPAQMYQALPSNTAYKDILQNGTSAYSDQTLQAAGIGETVVELPTATAARAFIQQQGCATQDQCKKPFVLEPYGSSYLLVDDISKSINRILSIALPIAIVIAGIIIWAAMTRIIIDSRHETAVFRALGAKRIDIITIYVMYSLNVAMRIVLCSLLLGISTALVIQALYSNQVTDYVRVAYSVLQGPSFSFLGFGSPLLIWLVICALSISLLAVIPPLLRNVRRNPINDMRDE